MQTPHTFIQEHVALIAPLEHRANLALWNQFTTGDEKYATEMKKIQTELRQIYSSQKEYQTLLSLSSSDDPLIQRQIKLLADRFQENQIPPELIAQMVELEVEIESTYTRFRPLLKESRVSDNDIKKILADSENSAERQAAWEASKQIGAVVENRVLELVKLRNKAARLAGFADFYTMRLELQEIDSSRLFEILDSLDKLSSALWKEYKQELDKSLSSQFHIPVERLMPWHYPDPFFQEAPQQEIDFDAYYKGKDPVAISERYYATLGLGVDDILKRSDLFERDKKNQHAFCLNLDRNQDIRILCNLRDTEYWMATQLHELGHAVYDKYIDPELPYLLRTHAHISTTEAIAMLFGRKSTDPEFLSKFCETPLEDPQKAKRQISINLLVFARWVLVMTHFERALYQNPAIDLHAFWWQCVEKYQNIKKPEGRDAPDWASKLHLACAPVYYQNYILGEMTASQLMRHLGNNPGQYLKSRVFHLGARYPWEETLFQATGEKLNPRYFIEDIQP